MYKLCKLMVAAIFGFCFIGNVFANEPVTTQPVAQATEVAAEAAKTDDGSVSKDAKKAEKKEQKKVENKGKEKAE